MAKLGGKLGKMYRDVQKAGAGTPLVPGRYLGQVVEHEYKAEKGKTPLVSTKLEVLSGPPQADGSDPAKRVTFDSIYFKEDAKDGGAMALGRLKSLLESVGVTYDPESGWNEKKVIGKKVGFQLVPGNVNPKKPDAVVYPSVKCYFDASDEAVETPVAKKGGKGKAKAEEEWGD